MTFLHNKTNLRIKENYSHKINYIGTLPINSFDSLAVEFYSNPIINSAVYSERPYLYTSNVSNNVLSYSDTYSNEASTNKVAANNLKGSLTIEAAISIPIYMMLISVLISITSILYLQLSMQIALEETVRKSTKTAYISSLFLSLDEDQQQTVKKSDDSIIENITTSLLSATYLTTVFTGEKNKKLVNSPMIINGKNGINFYSSSIDFNEGIADIILNYKVKLPFLPEKFFHFNLTNRCYIHLYTGKPLAKKQAPVDYYVYFTSHGNVFHFNRYCQYLLDYTDAVAYKKLEPDISPCARCTSESTDHLKYENPIVYITKSREFFHVSLNCPTFTGDVFRTSYSSLDDSDKICEKCLKGK